GKRRGPIGNGKLPRAEPPEQGCKNGLLPPASPGWPSRHQPSTRVRSCAGLCPDRLFRKGAENPFHRTANRALVRLCGGKNCLGRNKIRPPIPVPGLFRDQYLRPRPGCLPATYPPFALIFSFTFGRWKKDYCG